MSLINLELENEQIINDYFKDLCCDNYTIPFLLGGQSNADNALNQLNINKYATKRNNVYPKDSRGSSYLSPYIRHGLLSLSDVWRAVEKFEYKDKTKFQDELLWQEFSRHLYAIVGKKSRNYLNYKIENPDTYHSVDFVAKKIFQRQTYEWFQKDNNKNNKENNNNEIT